MSYETRDFKCTPSPVSTSGLRETVVQHSKRNQSLEELLGPSAKDRVSDD